MTSSARSSDIYDLMAFLITSDLLENPISF